jgi:hypothetical protein
MSKHFDTLDNHRRAVRQYSLDTLQAILSDLGKNPLTYRDGTWECQRNSAITVEIKRRKKELAR